MIGLLMAWAVVGTEGIPIPYSPRMDDGITVVLLCCFFLSAYVLSRSRKFLLQLVKDFLLHRERTPFHSRSFGYQRSQPLPENGGDGGRKSYDYD